MYPDEQKKAGDFPPLFVTDCCPELFNLLHFIAAGAFARVLADGVALAFRPAGAGILAGGLEGALLLP